MREIRYRFVCDGCGRVVEGNRVLESPEDIMMEDEEPALPSGWLEVYAEDEDRVYTCCSWECVEMLANRGGRTVAAVAE